MEWKYESLEFGILSGVWFWLEETTLYGIFIPDKDSFISIGQTGDITISCNVNNNWIEKYLIIEASILVTDSSGICLFRAKDFKIL